MRESSLEKRDGKWLVNHTDGGLGVTRSPRDPTVSGSNPVDFDGFAHAVKVLREEL